MDGFLWLSLQRSGILKKIYRKPLLNDEPKFFGFGVELDLEKIHTDGEFPDAYSSGSSKDEATALLKAIFEGVERFNLAEFEFKEFVFGSCKDVDKSILAVAPRNFCYLSKNQINDKDCSDFCFSNKCKFYWTKCKDLTTNRDVLLPSQVIYCPYKYKNNEKILTFPITTGASVAENTSEALYKGICEVIERDAYITNYLLRLEPNEIIYKDINSKVIIGLLEDFKKYDLEIKSYILVSEFRIPTVLSAIIDRTGKGPALCIGLKTDWSLEKAIIGSIEEAFQIRLWIRMVMIEDKWSGDTYTNKNMLRRAYLWKDLSGLKKFGFVLNSRGIAKVSDEEINKYSNKSPKEKLKLIKQELAKSNRHIYYKDVTSKTFKKMGLTIVKCIVPDLHPMFINQDFPYLGGKRIGQLMKRYNIKTLNLYPHPFL